MPRDHPWASGECKDGRIIPVSLTISPIRDQQGSVIGVSKIARDLSETQRVHQELKRREALISSILETVPDALIVVDERGHIVSFSVGAERVFGYSSAEMLGRNVSLMMPFPLRGEHDSYLARYLATGERRIIGVGRIVIGKRKDGSTFPMELAIGEINMPNVRLFTAFVRDVTERQERERRLSDLQSELVHNSRSYELGQMVSALAHEVNQPLTALINYLSGARRLLVSGNPQAALRAMERIAEQADRARQIIQRLRSFVGKSEAERRIESVLTTIEEASALAMVGAGQDVELKIRVADDASEAMFDKVQIQQVLFNLMRNALEAMAGLRSRQLTISAGRVGDRVEIRVADNGPGVPEDVRARLFQPFVTTKANGMGVGLSVSRTIVEAHGGELRAEDVEGGGTVFRFTVPPAPLKHQPAQAAKVTAAPDRTDMDQCGPREFLNESEDRV